jgi:hypothetical protein
MRGSNRTRSLLTTGKRMQDWCRENLLKFQKKEMWPPSLTDCNLLNDLVFDACELHVNKLPQSTTGLLLAVLIQD